MQARRLVDLPVRPGLWWARRPLVGATLVLLVLAAIAQPAGASWAQQATQNPAGSTGLLASVSCISKSSCTAVGSYADNAGTHALAEARTGSAWAVEPTPDPVGSTDTELDGVACSSASACVAVGTYTSGAGVEALAETWSGGSWTIDPVPEPAGSTDSALEAVACSAATSCVAVGSSTTGSDTQTLAETFDGSGWTIRTTHDPAGSLDSSFAGVACTAATSCVAVGLYTSGADTLALVERWSGTGWVVQPAPDPAGSTFTELNAVSCTAATACTAVGLAVAERWNGTSWSLQTLATPPGNSGAGADLNGVACTTATSCTGVGGYYRQGVQTLAGEQWNGTSWKLADVPLTTSNDSSDLLGLSCSGTSACTAVGDYDDPVDGTMTLGEVFMLQWQMQYLPPPAGALSSQLTGVSCVSAKACIAVGEVETSSDVETLAEQWDGTGWTSRATAEPTTSYLSGVSCTSPTACTAVGDAESGGTTLALAERWNGTSWSVQTTPSPAGTAKSDFAGVSCSSATNCAAVGTFTKSGGHAFTLVEQWNGSSWKVVGSPNQAGASSSVLNGVSCTSVTACSAVGYTLSPSYSMLAERWNGSSWSIDATPNPPGGSDSYLTGVSCASASACTAVGSYFDGSDTVTLSEQWDGSGWTAYAAADPGGATASFLNGVSCTAPTSCSAVGGSQKGGGAFKLLTERWSGTGWSVEPSQSPPGAEGSYLAAGSCSSSTTCTGVGFYNDSSDTVTMLAEQYS